MKFLNLCLKKTIERKGCNRQKNIRILIGIELFLQMRVHFNYIHQKKRFGSFLVEKKCFVLLSIHQKFMFEDIFLLLDLVSYFVFRGIGTLMLNLCVLFMSRVF